MTTVRILCGEGWCSKRRWFLICAITAIAALVFGSFVSPTSEYLSVIAEDMSVSMRAVDLLRSNETLTDEAMRGKPPIWTNDKATTIAYAVSITGCPKKGRTSLIDGASVLHQSIRLASRSSKYDYHMIAFVHPEATECASLLDRLGYETQIRETPFNETAISNSELQKAQGNSCCGAKEYLKLYSYLQFEYPVVVHLDLDCLVLRPMDDVFDLMLDASFNRSRIPSMWLRPEEIPEQVDFVFTRDYGMVDPPRRQPHQIGVQGGFLIIRPNQTDFDRYVELLLSGGDFELGSGWGGRTKGYGGYYGAGTIQGLASYYYGEFAQNRSLELNRCKYNTMVDNPYSRDGSRCRTLEEECEDCRTTEVSDIYTAHFTVCGKPFWCPNPVKWWHNQIPMDEHYRLCMDLFREWHLVRLSLENEWRSKYPNYKPKYASPRNTTDKKGYYLSFSQGHCSAPGRYVKMTFPSTKDEPTSLIPKEITPSVEPLSDNKSTKTKIAYAVTVTHCNKDQAEHFSILDGAAVLHESIRLASKNSKYGYAMIAFVHPQARQCSPFLSNLGYEVQIRRTPFNESAIPNEQLAKAQENSCCGAKEYLKLYSYLQFDYPVVVHLDTDTLVLKAMDDVFDLMLDPSFDRSRIPAMWLQKEQFPERVDFLFTRDYNMVDPPVRQPYQIGVQGGFLVVRPNETDFKRLVNIIMSGGDGYRIAHGWGGKDKQYGGYYGAGTIQGLASYYYGEYAPNRSVELNRCYYNTMVDDPMGLDRSADAPPDKMRCRTLEESCQDCRKVDLENIYTTHFTVCRKPHWCPNVNEETTLCTELHRRWHRTRLSLEQEWMHIFSEYQPGYLVLEDSRKDDDTLTFGHCRSSQRGFDHYFPLEIPAALENMSKGSLL